MFSIANSAKKSTIDKKPKKCYYILLNLTK